MLQTIYKEFLTNPDVSFLTDDVCLHHITTLITSSSPSAVIKHLKSTEVKRKKQEFIDIVEGPTSLAVIVNTTLEFVNGGGPILPNLDDNFIVDRSVTLPITHFVSFNSNAKIRQIRLNWDQGSLLKLIDIIGKTGRNWPIHNGEDQIRLISSSVKPKIITDNVAGIQVHGEINSKPAREQSTNAAKDSHASLNLFSSHNQTSHGAYPSAHRNEFGSNFISTEKKKDPAKFKHFEFTNGAPNEEKPSPRVLTKTSKHGSHWNFDDFTTPQKNVPSKVLRTNDVQHWGNSDNELLESPEQIKKMIKPRKDIETHFELQDVTSDSEDQVRINSRIRGKGHNNGLGLYKDLFDKQNGSTVGPHESTVPSLANVKDRRKDLEAHFTMSDRSPGISPRIRMTEDNVKGAQVVNSTWLAYDHPPTQKENISSTAFQIRGSNPGRPLAEATNTMNKRNGGHKGIRTGGDGMGGKKGTERSWGFGDDSDGEEEGGINKPGKYRTGKQSGKPQALGGDFWDF